MCHYVMEWVGASVPGQADDGNITSSTRTEQLFLAVSESGYRLGSSVATKGPANMAWRAKPLDKHLIRDEAIDHLHLGC